MISSISVKVVGMFAGLSFVLLFGVSVYSLSNHRRHLTESLAEKAKSSAYAIQSNINNRETLADKGKLQTIIDKNMLLDADVTGISFSLLVDGKMIIQASSDLLSVGKLSNSNNTEAYTNNITVSDFETRGKEKLVIMVVPIRVSGETIGAIQVDYTLENVEVRVVDEMKRMILVLASISILFLFLVFLIVRSIVVTPINKISKGLEAIQRKEFGNKVNLHTGDEFERLGSFLNSVSEELGAVDIKSKTDTEKLEQEVRDRTKELNDKKDSLESIVFERTRELTKIKDDLEKTVEERTKDLSEKISEVEKINNFMVNRELKMTEMKTRIKELESKVGKT